MLGEMYIVLTQVGRLERGMGRCKRLEEGMKPSSKMRLAFGWISVAQSAHAPRSVVSMIVESIGLRGWSDIEARLSKRWLKSVGRPCVRAMSECSRTVARLIRTDGGSMSY